MQRTEREEESRSLQVRFCLLLCSTSNRPSSLMGFGPFGICLTRIMVAIEPCSAPTFIVVFLESNIKSHVN